ncbi:2,3,4,5-tetrahydropyridine-2,6-dicarboxylate N-succinyltransferase [Nonomuraea sp. NPDC050783]|uniref:2,3,4,5-tetrahydropyridine-2,6-dicarboxylate N-succinyltransferase n=1 Tax=Nonomuraea sp. NPDC050783 TaxID=3154634 RepID=UPI003467CB65
MSDVSTSSPISPVVDELWERRAELSPRDAEARHAVVGAVDLLDTGVARAARLVGGEVEVDERAGRAILLASKVLGMARSQVGDFQHHDRIPLKSTFDGVRVVPGAIARWGSYLAPGVVLMPSFTDIGAYVDEGTTVGTWATVGSCAQIGRNVHLSGGAGIGGVLERPGAVPVVIEDEVLVGGRSMIVDGARVGRGAVVGAGTILSASTPVIDVETGEELARGHVPDWCVAVGGTRQKQYPGGTFGLPCVLVIKRLEPGQRHDEAALDEVLREHGVNA